MELISHIQQIKMIEDVRTLKQKEPLDKSHLDRAIIFYKIQSLRQNP